MKYPVRYDTNYYPNGSKTKLYVGTIRQLSNATDTLRIEFASLPSGFTPYLNVARYAKDKSYIDSTPTLIGFDYVDGGYEKTLIQWFSEIAGFIDVSVTLLGAEVEIDGEITQERIECGAFYLNIDGVVISQGDTLPPPPPPTEIEFKVDKDLSTYDEVAAIVDDAFTFVDNDGSPEKMEIENNGIDTDLKLMTKGYTMSELDKKVDKSVVDVKYFANVGGVKILSTTVPTAGAIGTPSDGIQAQNTASSIGWKELGIFERTTTADITVNSTTIFNENLSFRVSRNTQASQIRISIYNDGAWGSVTVDTPAHNSGTFSTGIISVICNSIPVGTEIVLPSGDKYYVKVEYYQTQNAPLTVDLVCIQGGLVSTSQFMITGTSITTDLIQDNAVTNAKLAQMPTLTMKGNDRGATANAKDLTISEILALLSSGGTMQVPANLQVNGNIYQNGTLYTTDVEYVRSTDNFIELRYGAVAGLNSGEYTGFKFALYDGTNNGYLVVDKDGYAKVGDEGSLQSLATRQDSPVANAVAYWNDTLKRFDTSSKFTFNGSSGSINELTVTNDAIGDVPLIVNAMVGTTAYLQKWQVNGTDVAWVNSAGRFTSDNGLVSASGFAYALVQPSPNGTVISRNIADANPALKVQNSHTDSTGNIVEFWSNQSGTTAVRAWISKSGSIYTPLIYSSNGVSNGYLSLSVTGMILKRDINDANSTLTINNQQGTGNILNLQFGGVNKATIDKDGMATFLGGILEPTIKNNAIADVPLTINAITGQTGKLQSWQVNSVEKAYIDKDGKAYFTSLSTGINTLFGTLNGPDLTTGNYNTLIGYTAGYKLTEGTDNVAIGKSALQDSLTTDYAIAIGTRALERLLTGDNTIGIGRYAGRYYGSGTDDLSSTTNSIYIGNEARAKENSVTNEIVIGYNALGNGSNTATIGNSSLTKLYAGIYEVDRVIKSSSVSVSSWSADTTYSGYGYRATITMTGTTSSDTAEVVYAHAEAISGDYSPICETLTDGVYIYSKVNTTITLAQVIVHKA